VPYGYLFSSAGIAVLTALAATGRSRPRIVGALSFRAAMILNEQPFLVLAWLTLSTLLAVVQDDIATPVGWVALAFTALGAAGQLYVLRVALMTTSATERALHDGLGAGWRAAIDTRIARRPSTHLPWVRIVFAPFAVGRRDVERVANLRYGDAGRQNLLDLYRRRARPTDGPVLVYFHGGGFSGGNKRREARALLTHLASRGWVCISANYRLHPHTRRDALIDAKRVVAWIRAHAHEYGADPTAVFLAGGSAGGYLSAMAAFTQNDPSLQPGFEHADTSITAAIPLYGYFGDRGEDAPGTSPLTTDATGAPPFFVVHGDHDTLALF
jgi:acetyl esterase/lipase